MKRLIGTYIRVEYRKKQLDQENPWDDYLQELMDFLSGRMKNLMYLQLMSEKQKKNQLITEGVIVMQLGKRLDIKNNEYLNFELDQGYHIVKISKSTARKIVLKNYVHVGKEYRLRKGNNYRILESGICPFINYQCSWCAKPNRD